jgi:hypothetical protein
MTSVRAGKTQVRAASEVGQALLLLGAVLPRRIWFREDHIAYQVAIRGPIIGTIPDETFPLAYYDNGVHRRVTG